MGGDRTSGDGGDQEVKVLSAACWCSVVGAGLVLMLVHQSEAIWRHLLQSYRDSMTSSRLPAHARALERASPSSSASRSAPASSARPAGIARRVPSPTVMLGCGSLGGAITLCGALSVAELAAALPESGGFYAYLREGWGRPTAFLFGWAELVADSCLRARRDFHRLRRVLPAVARRRSGRRIRPRPGRSRPDAIAFAASANIVGASVGADDRRRVHGREVRRAGCDHLGVAAAGRPARRHASPI